MSQVLIQARVDEDLKKEVSQIYADLGIDLPTAIRMFLVRSKMVRGIPFDMTLPKEKITRQEALNALEDMFMQTKDLPDMSLDEINDEIKEVRKLKRGSKK